MYRRVLYCALGLLLLMAGRGGMALDLPDMGKSSDMALSPLEEEKLGAAFMRKLRESEKLFDDPALEAYFNTLGYRLVAHSDDPAQKFTFFMLKDADINAFAVPGGYIGVHSGLFLHTRGESELASVLAHEIAHVTQRHLARRFQKAQQTSLQTAAAVIAAILLASKNPEVAEAAIFGSTAGGIQQQLNFSREHEQEADRVGIDILSRSGYDPIHMAGFFHRLQNAYRFQQSAVPEILRTHPVTPNRIADAENRAKSLKPKSPYPGAPEFSLIQTKLKTQTLDANQLQPRRNEIFALINESKATTDRNLVYEYALLSLQGNYLDAAHAAAEQLLRAEPEHTFFISLMASIEAARGELPLAITRLQQALVLYPNHAYLSFLYAHALRLNNETQHAIRVLKQLTQQHPQTEPAYFKALAQAYDQSGDAAQSYIAMAEFYYLLGQTRTAITQLEAAMRKLPQGDQYQRQRLDSRIDVLKREALLEEAAVRR